MKLEWSLKAFREIRRLPVVEQELFRRAEAVARACGAGFVAERGGGSTRARAAVFTASDEARRANARDNTILRNVGAGRG